jgi:5-oxoprolinase (ATP-hydrolysing)
LTVTDVNLFLGKIAPDHFPFPLDREAVSMRFLELSDQIEAATTQRLTPVQLANGFVQIANANMSQAIRSISIAKGHDVRDYVLVAFGGAGAQHACGVADALQMTRILIHPDAGILSAVGIDQAQVARHVATGVYESLDRISLEALELKFLQLEQSATAEIIAEGIGGHNVECHRSADLRFSGTDTSLNVAFDEFGFESAFHAAHELRYGWTNRDRPIEIVTIRVEATSRTDDNEICSRIVTGTEPTPFGATTMTFGEAEFPTSTYLRANLKPGDRMKGPAQVLEDHATTIVDPDWAAMVLSGGELLLTRDESEPPIIDAKVDGITSADPIRLEIFNRHFESIAEQMGITLRNTSSSTNVKERLDFSCAIFTATGGLVVNAPHIPVHLGAMGQTIQAILEDHVDIRPGDVFITNDPYRGGSHLPDVTVVTPVFDNFEGGKSKRDSLAVAVSHMPTLLFFTASRAHHAEIGGVTPGSMPPFSRNLAEEGVLIRSRKLFDGGVSRFDELELLLSNAPYPSRDVATNLADVGAQVAANRQGARDLLRLTETHTWPVVSAYMAHIQTAAEQKTRQALSRMPDGVYEFADQMDCGAIIRVRIQIVGDSARIDFTGTSPVLPSNLNANRAIVTAAVLYVLRTMIGEPIPLNQGVLTPVTIHVPESMLNPPSLSDPKQCAAVVGGNVETSQRIVDVLLGALGLAAASQGTMNNVLFGNETFGYYETICGGAGATARSDGASAVHTHMTNTRITDPEILERRYPVRVLQFSIREGSGGAGHHRGGDGVVREIEFLAPLTVSLLTQRRSGNAPYGMNGGEPGAFGHNHLVRSNGQRVELGGREQIAVEPGDRLIVKTPGGGGFDRA